jgi:hypothetical protein
MEVQEGIISKTRVANGTAIASMKYVNSLFMKIDLDKKN